MTTVAVGLASGSVYIYQGEIARVKLAHNGKLSCRAEGGQVVPVTALHFVPPSSNIPVSDSGQWLWVVTEAQTLALRLGDGLKNILDQSGSPTGGCVQVVEFKPDGPVGTHQEKEKGERREWRLVVARADALYDYTLDTRAGCTVFDGKVPQCSPYHFGTYTTLDLP